MLVNALIFPVTLSVSLLGAWKLFSVGVDPGIIVGIASAITVSVIVIAEKT